MISLLCIHKVIDTIFYIIADSVALDEDAQATLPVYTRHIIKQVIHATELLYLSQGNDHHNNCLLLVLLPTHATISI